MNAAGVVLLSVAAFIVVWHIAAFIVSGVLLARAGRDVYAIGKVMDEPDPVFDAAIAKAEDSQHRYDRFCRRFVPWLKLTDWRTGE